MQYLRPPAAEEGGCGEEFMARIAHIWGTESASETLWHFAAAPLPTGLGVVGKESRGLTVLVHAHLQTFLQSARLALVAMSLVHHAPSRTGLAPGGKHIYD